MESFSILTLCFNSDSFFFSGQFRRDSSSVCLSLTTQPITCKRVGELAFRWPNDDTEQVMKMMKWPHWFNNYPGRLHFLAKWLGPAWWRVVGPWPLLGEKMDTSCCRSASRVDTDVWRRQPELWRWICTNITLIHAFEHPSGPSSVSLLFRNRDRRHQGFLAVPSPFRCSIIQVVGAERGGMDSGVESQLPLIQPEEETQEKLLSQLVLKHRPTYLKQTN